MTSINVKIPKRMEEEIELFLKNHPYYLNKSELVRDAIRHILCENRRLSKETLQIIEEGRKEVESGKGLSLKQVKEELDD
jgi:Arc/MetJ-type ribon-helix-helix transcriptional regulator